MFMHPPIATENAAKYSNPVSLLIHRYFVYLFRSKHSTVTVMLEGFYCRVKQNG
jgi:hypothetical protein